MTSLSKGFIPTFAHGDALLMSAASTVVMASYVLLPHTLDAGYLRFLNGHIQVRREMKR